MDRRLAQLLQTSEKLKKNINNCVDIYTFNRTISKIKVNTTEDKTTSGGTKYWQLHPYEQGNAHRANPNDILAEWNIDTNVRLKVGIDESDQYYEGISWKAGWFRIGGSFYNVPASKTKTPGYFHFIKESNYSRTGRVEPFPEIIYSKSLTTVPFAFYPYGWSTTEIISSRTGTTYYGYSVTGIPVTIGNLTAYPFSSVTMFTSLTFLPTWENSVGGDCGINTQYKIKQPHIPKAEITLDNYINQEKITSGTKNIFYTNYPYIPDTLEVMIKESGTKGYFILERKLDYTESNFKINQFSMTEIIGDGDSLMGKYIRMGG